MFKRVDAHEETFEGFSYLNSLGREDFVCIMDGYDTVKIEVSNGESLEFSLEEVPNLVKALKSAYTYKTGEEI